MIAPASPMRCRVPTPFAGDLLIVGNGEVILGSSFVPAKRVPEPNPSDALLADVAAQVRAYFRRRLRRFDVPFALDGTPLQLDAWRAVALLAFGEFVSYGDVARAIGRPLAHRGVASAMARSPLDLFIPAHRVVGVDGRVKGVTANSVRFRLAEFERFKRR
jgi:methylated-DNA-[protein]-cysteine S-methyltransferase